MVTASDMLARWAEAGIVSDGDLAFAGLMRRLDPEGPAALEPAAALAFSARARGHVCLDLRSPAGPRPGEETAAIPPDAAEAAAAWPDALRASKTVGAPGAYRPLVLDARDRLYLYRYWKLETDLASDVRRRMAAGPVPPVDPARLREGLARLFPEADAWDQRRAAALAVLHPLALVCGGPGTGKTTTVVRLLALLIEQAGPSPPRIALAAPTGKAAARLQESIARAIPSLAVEASVRDALPREAGTLHRLLGARGPGRGGFRYDRTHPLPFDVVVVDEASMIDLALMARLAAAVPETARLILLGDRDQLASVEAGRVWSDLTGTARGSYGEAAAAGLDAALENEPVPRDPSGGDALRIEDRVALLSVPRRFDAAGGIARLAEGIRQGDAEGTWALLSDGSCPDLAWHSAGGESPRHGLPRPLAERMRAAFAAVKDPEDALAALFRIRILCAHRTGPRGVPGLNEAVARAVHSAWAGADGETAGRPVLVTRNDAAAGLFNGDMGITWPGPDGGLRVLFPRPEGGWRAVHPSRLPEHETAYAMTVHKSQGSEFEEVALILPDAGSPLLTREWLYTAATRARRRLEVWGAPDAWHAAIRTRVARASGLREQLTAGPAATASAP